MQYAQFVPVESTRAYLQALHAYLARYGRPAAFYSDRHSIFTKHDPEDPTPTQFERAVRSLDIEPILALTPQAKGRVERAFQTLQDRLVKALRLERIGSLAAANAYLPRFVARYNARFARAPLAATDAHRPLTLTAEQLQWTCCAQFERTLSRSLSCQYRGELYLIDTAGASAYHLRGARVILCDPGNEQPIVLLHAGKPLPYRRFPKVSLPPARIADDKTLDQMVDTAQQRQARSAGHKPPPDHPWLGPFRRPRPKTVSPASPPQR